MSKIDSIDKETSVDHNLNMSVRKFLKQVGVTSQQAIEKAWRESNLTDDSELDIKVVLTMQKLNLEHIVSGKITGKVDS